MEALVDVASALRSGEPVHICHVPDVQNKGVQRAGSARGNAYPPRNFGFGSDVQVTACACRNNHPLPCCNLGLQPPSSSWKQLNG
jgi:hypothetical protein